MVMNGNLTEERVYIRPEAFTDTSTHYCPGCTHGTAHRLVAEVIDPIANTTYSARAEVAGVMYARLRDRYVIANDDLANIAGSKPFRTGYLLSA